MNLQESACKSQFVGFTQRKMIAQDAELRKHITVGQAQQRASRHSEELNLRSWICLKLLMGSLDTASRD